jgi:DNA-binding winged helix-turn-helix (wHTH) protein
MNKIVFDKFSRTLSRDEVKKKIGSKDALVLEFLFISGPGGATKSDILAYAWQGLVVTDASLSKSISTLRSVLTELNPDEEIIITIPRVGYKIDQDKISLPNSIKDDSLSIENAELKIEKFTPNNLLIKKITKVIILIVSITLFILYTYKLVVSVPYMKQSFMSPLLVKETLKNNNVILFSRAVDKNYYISKIANINCECLFMLYTNDHYNFFSTYLKNEGRAINIIFKKDEDFNLEDFIRNEVNVGNGNQHD